MLTRPPHSNLRAIIRSVILSLSAALLPLACDSGKHPLEPTPTLTGKVSSSATGTPVAGAKVHLGAATATTDAEGRFEFTDLTRGAATLRATATGFVDFETAVTVTSGTVTYDVGLTRIEVFEFGDFGMYVPASVDSTQGLILALGGPDTRGFATGKPMGAPIPAVEASLQALGQAFRTLASTHRLAVMGTSRAAMANSPANDTLLLGALNTAATTSGRHDLASAPVVMYGMSGGAPQASGFTARNPEWVAGLFLKVPSGVSSVRSGNALGVPTYVVLAELDAFVNNAALTTAFEGNRGAGALWALAREAAVPHHSLTPVQRQLTINWISTILEARLPDVLSDPLRGIAETSGWLGNRATGEAAPWATFSGDRALASWLPSQAIAEEWETFVGIHPAGFTALRQTSPIR